MGRGPWERTSGGHTHTDPPAVFSDCPKAEPKRSDRSARAGERVGAGSRRRWLQQTPLGTPADSHFVLHPILWPQLTVRRWAPHPAGPTRVLYITSGARMQAVWLPSVTKTWGGCGTLGPCCPGGRDRGPVDPERRRRGRREGTVCMWPLAPHGACSGLLLLMIVNPGPKRGACTHPGLGDLCVVAPPRVLSSFLPLRWDEGRTLTFTPSNPHLPAPRPRAPRGLSVEGKETNHRALKPSIEFNASYRRKLHQRIQDKHCFSILTSHRTALPVQKKLSLKTHRQLLLPGPTFHILPLTIFSKT